MDKEEKRKHKRVLEEMRKRKLKRTWLGRTFYFIWYEDSFLSWVVNILIAFVFIKFIFYPLLGLLFSTGIPVVAVVSCSMDHGFTNCGDSGLMNNLCGIPGEGYSNFNTYWDNCGAFYEQKGITKEIFKEFNMNKGFKKGEIIFLKGTTLNELKLGDIVVFTATRRSYPIIHRVIKKETDHFETKGDHNKDQIQDAFFNEKNIKEEQILGKAFFKVPYLGYIKIWFTDLVNLVK